MNPERRVRVYVCTAVGCLHRGPGEHTTGYHTASASSLEELLTLRGVKQPPVSLMSYRGAARMALAIPEVRAGTKGDPGAVAQCYGVKAGSNRNQYASWLFQDLPEASWLSL